MRGLYYNPNIHPYQEYLRRLEGLEQVAEALDFEVIYLSEYDMEKYFREVVYRENQRCRVCYYMRLKRTAQVAKHGNFDAFTTTLLVSPFQNQDLIKEIGEQAGKEVGVPFLFQDFRSGFKETVNRSKEMGIYRQQYCGCIYSEKDRYTPRSRARQKQAGG